jgi:hypothetical protein
MYRVSGTGSAWDTAWTERSPPRLAGGREEGAGKEGEEVGEELEEEEEEEVEEEDEVEEEGRLRAGKDSVEVMEGGGCVK